eukprot:10611479-Heterocapsa_arctica.AAC.1
MQYARFHQMGKGGLSPAVQIAYKSNFDPAAPNEFRSCAFTSSNWHALQVQSTNAPVVVEGNVFLQSMNGGVVINTGSTLVMVVNNAVVGVAMSPYSPTMLNEMTEDVRVVQFAGIRADERPQKMYNNV